MKSIEERALETYPINNLYFESEYQVGSHLIEGEDRNLKLRDAYIKGASDQKAIDNEQYRKDMRYVGVKREELIEKAWRWFNMPTCGGWDKENFTKAMLEEKL